jgi:hypothetical protein
MLRNIYQWRTAFRDERGRKLTACPICDVESASVCVKNAHRPFHDESMQFVRANCSPERFAQAVEEIENQCLFDLNFFM